MLEDEKKEKKEELIVHGYDWVCEDLQEKERVQIRGWCLDRESNAHLIRIEDFPNFCYLELPLFIHGTYFRWSKSSAQEVFIRLSDQLQKWNESAPTAFEFVYMPKLYYYRGERTYPMLLLYFKRMSDVQKCEKIVKDDGLFFPQFSHYNQIKLFFRLWETNIDILRKFFTVRQTGISQWFRVQGCKIIEEEKKMSTLEREYIVDWRTLTAIPQEQTKTWLTHPSTLSFDIETYSDNPKTMPNKLHANHVAFMISCIWQKGPLIETRKRYAIVLGPSEDVENVTIIRVTDEMQLIDEFCRLIQTLDPDIIIGYNIFGYDYPYLQARLDLNLREWKNMSRMRPYFMKNKAGVEIDLYQPKIDVKRWQSSGYGHNELHILQIEGRIHIDLLPLVKRSRKLDNYKLDTVAMEFLGKSKHDVKPEEMFETYKLCQKVKENAALREEATKKMTRVLRYCVQDAELVTELFDNLIIWIDLIEMSNIVGVTPMKLFTRGQQIRCLSLIYDYAARKGIVLDQREQITENFEGGFVYDPIAGLHDFILCFDFASLYPSIMETSNICYSTLVPPELMNTIPDDQCHVFDFYQDSVVAAARKKEEGEGREALIGEEAEAADGKVVQIHKRFKFIKEKRGIIPEIVHNLVQARKEARAEKEKEENPSTKQVLEARQLALKTTANSIFGFLGVSNGKLPLIEGAMCITAKGREMINFVNDYLRKTYNARIIYNDTDSSMVDLGITRIEDCNPLGKKLAEEISALFPPPIKIEFEKAMRILCIKKKKYAAVLIGKDNTYKFNPKDILKRGILVARRDNFQKVRGTYMDLLLLILKREPIEKAFGCIYNASMKMISGEIPYTELKVTRELGSHYKSESYFMNVFAQELRKAGKQVNAGERIGYVIVQKENEKLLGKRMRTLEWYEEMPIAEREKIDYLYYLEKGFMKPLDQLFSIGYKDILERMNERHIGYKPKGGRSKFIPVSEPIRMMVKMIKDGNSLSSLKEWFSAQLADLEYIYISIPPNKKEEKKEGNFIKVVL